MDQASLTSLSVDEKQHKSKNWQALEWANLFNSATLKNPQQGYSKVIGKKMKKLVQFAPNGIVLTFNVNGANLSEVLFIALSSEQKSLLKGMDGFSLTRLNYGPRSMILGNQSRYVEVTAIKSCRLRQDWSTENLFSEYREHCFVKEEYEFLD